MLKKTLLLFAALLLLFSSARGEQAEPALIEAREGEKSALQIRSLTSDSKVGILGVESEARPRRWEDFSASFTGFVKNNWEEDVAFSPALWSGGRWMRLAAMGQVVVRVFTTDDTPDGLIQEIAVTGFDMESAADTQVITGAAYWAAAQCGEYGKIMLQILFMEDHSEDWFDQEPMNVWRENGFQLSLGLGNMDCPQGSVVYLEEAPTLGGYAPFAPEALENLPLDLTAEDMLSHLRALVGSGPLAGYVSLPPALPDAWEAAGDGRVYAIQWDDCLLLLYTDEEGKQLRLATLCGLSGDTVSACFHLYPLYNAIVDPARDRSMVLSGVMGGHGTWEEMCALDPFCVWNGVMLQCDAEERDGSWLPFVFICGARQ